MFVMYMFVENLNFQIFSLFNHFVICSHLKIFAYLLIFVCNSVLKLFVEGFAIILFFIMPSIPITSFIFVQCLMKHHDDKINLS